MKKCIASILLVILLLSATAQAADSRALSGHPALTIDGTTALCEAVYSSSDTTDKLKVVLTLYCGDDVVDAWTRTAYGSVVMSETCEVERNKRYDMVMSTYCNGVAKSEVSVYAYS